MRILAGTLALTFVLCSCKDVADVAPQRSDSSQAPKAETSPPTEIVTVPEVDEQQSQERLAQQKTEAEQQDRRVHFLELRQAQTGKQFETLTLANKTYHDAKVDSISDTHIKIVHPNGIAMVPWQDVKPLVQTAWGFDPGAFGDLQARREAELAARLKRENDPQRIAQRAKLRKEQAEIAAQEEKEKTRQRIKDLEAEIKRGKTAIHQLENAVTEVKEKYLKEDQRAEVIKGSRADTNDRRIGGIKTSRQDRARIIAAHVARVDAAKKKLAQLEASLEKLRSL